MQIDGHHTMTYVAARSAGWSKNLSILIACSVWRALRAQKSVVRLWADWSGTRGPRNNSQDYVEAIQKMPRVMQAWCAGDGRQ